ncbi:MAG: hypothetical protein LUE10_06420 [Alistipes sp.]|nr:hypothetical protein [Alistipes sp.]
MNLKVSAGRLSIIVKVVQGVDEKYSLELVDQSGDPVESLLFTTYGDALATSATPEQELTANWTPHGEACMVSYYTTGTYGLGFNSRTNPFTTDAVLYGGHKSYTVHPDDFTTFELEPEPFMEKSARANLVVGEVMMPFCGPLQCVRYITTCWLYPRIHTS